MIKIVFYSETRKSIQPNDKFIELSKRLDQTDYQGIIWETLIKGQRIIEFSGGNISL